MANPSTGFFSRSTRSSMLTQTKPAHQTYLVFSSHMNIKDKFKNVDVLTYWDLLNIPESFFSVGATGVLGAHIA
ncbi:hypothetical protein EUGRSUZ_F04290 [Eucalyptus grandis]|uniref:Uncharacterized protein n=2 Tax=Eucalyptus grandis TaxID=71139 RepID=A0ACC3KPF4_EUCGR|nr:hypothetical protein EUGRSUZ_F04290 [Eucalyptus grandis]